MMNKMNLLKQKIFILLFLSLNIGLYAQQTTVSAGGEASGSGGSVSYTVGQVVYTTSTTTNGTVAQGVQQPFEISEITGVSETGITLKMSVYPNPTTDYLQLDVDNEQNVEMLYYQLFGINGQLLQKQEILAVETQIKMADYKQGIYFLNIVANKQKLKSFKIVKN